MTSKPRPSQAAAGHTPPVRRASGEPQPEYSQLMAQLLRERSQRVQAEARLTVLEKKLAGRERKSKIVLRAIQDGHEILLRKATGFATGKITLFREGLPERRWFWAVAFLRYAGIVSLRPKASGLVFLKNDLESLPLFEGAARQLEASATALEDLRYYLPRSRKR